MIRETKFRTCGTHAIDPTSAKVTAMMKSLSDAYEINQFKRNKLIRTITATKNVGDVPACIDPGSMKGTMPENARKCRTFCSSQISPKAHNP